MYWLISHAIICPINWVLHLYNLGILSYIYISFILIISLTDLNNGYAFRELNFIEQFIKGYSYLEVVTFQSIIFT